MKKFLFTCIVTLLTLIKLPGQVIWTGPTVSFTKPSAANWTLVEHQDRITDNVWITRAEDRGIFNIKAETSYIQLNSPSDTEWAFGTTAEIGTLVFKDWATAIDRNPPDAINKNMVLHLITDAVYIDIIFTSWDIRTGGGFSYNRSSNPALSLKDFELKNTVRISPNPAINYVKISGIENREKYLIYNNFGVKVIEGVTSNNQELNISKLESGIYFVCLKSEKAMKSVVLE